MAASKTAIANRALLKLGEPRVSNIDNDAGTPAVTISDMWDQIRDATLAAYPWNFAVTRAQLAVEATNPSDFWGWANRYQYPVDFLALLYIRNSPTFGLEKGFIVTDEGAPLKIKYIARITDTSQFDVLFDEALAARLAVEASERLQQSNTKKQILQGEFQSIIKEAYASDAIQEAPVYPPLDAWLASREDSVFLDDIDFNA